MKKMFARHTLKYFQKVIRYFNPNSNQFYLEIYSKMQNYFQILDK